MSDGILVFIEHKAGTLNKVSLEGITAAQKLGGETGQKASAVVLGSATQALAQEIAAYDLARSSTPIMLSLRTTRRMRTRRQWNRSFAQRIRNT